METKIKKNPSFAQARYLKTKLYNIFDEAFLFDVSICCFFAFKSLPCKNQLHGYDVYMCNVYKHDSPLVGGKSVMQTV